MAQEKRKDPRKVIRIISACIAILLFSSFVLTVKILLSSNDDRRRKKRTQVVRLLKPPPPPKIKPRPVEEPKVKKEKVIETKMEEQETDQTDSDASDEPPMGDELGLDAEGGSGSDGFGLRAKKGARSLISGSYSDSALMRRYAWYTRILEEDLRKALNTYLEQNGGIPKDNLKAVVRIKLDDTGHILDIHIEKTCGDLVMDRTMEASLKMAKVSEPPPGGMPRTVKLKISVKG